MTGIYDIARINLPSGRANTEVRSAMAVVRAGCIYVGLGFWYEV